LQNTSIHPVHKILLILMSLAVLAVIGWVLFQAFDFYSMALTDRPHHEDYRQFRPAGSTGHLLGIVGSAMMLLLLIYSFRKRMRLMKRWGDLRVWLRYHIFLGVAGPLLVTLHTSFPVGGLVSVSFWSMAAVALSGVFGRYLYQQIPRNMLGEDLAVAEIENRQEEMLVQLSEKHGLDSEGVDGLEALAVGPLEKRSAPVALLFLPFQNLILARQLQTWVVGLETRDPSEAVDLAKTWALQARRLHLFHWIRDLFHYWHVFHKPFAVIMLLVMLVHVAVALALGYTG